jgi:sulfite exporter TauE/SafE
MGYLLAYNAGRLLTYTLLGLVLGLVGTELLEAASQVQARTIGRWIAGFFTMALGLYLAGWWLALGQLERLGGLLWNRVEPLGRHLLPVRTIWQALVLGTLWGFLPCGMVYAALAWSLTAGSATQGALLMLGFGLGTLPMMLAVGAAARGLGNIVRKIWVRRLVGLALVSFGLWMLLVPAGHQHSPTDTHAGHTQRTP